MFFSTTLVNAQQNTSNVSEYGVIKTETSERFVFPYESSNLDRKNPLVHTYDESIDVNWIMTIENNLTYTPSSEAKTIIKFSDSALSEKFIELALFEKDSKFWVAVNTNESGYIRVHERQSDGWSRDLPIVVSHASNQGLTVTNGKRIILDRLSLDGFILNSVSLYGKDDADSPTNAISGDISFDLIYGNPRDSPLYFLPIIMLIVMGGLILFLLKFKKRPPEKPQ
ncbi:MAG: hypothetical protein ACPKPY_04780 [Nitrososphaeraceae archaeon]